MRTVKNNRLKYAVCMLLAIAFVFCGSIPGVFAQGERTAPEGDFSQAAQKALLKQQVMDQIVADKAKFVEGLVGRWVSLTGDNGAELRAGLMGLSADRLADANSADSMVALNGILFEPDNLGDNSVDLVFNKVTPCRIIDTRNTVAGPIAANTQRNFDSNLANFSSQGGAASNCGLPGNDTAALFVILVAVDASGNGNLRAFPKDAAIPTAVVINFNSSNNLANSVIIPLKQNVSDSLEFTIRAAVSSTDVVADVVGFFWSPESTPLDQTLVRTTSATIAGGASFTVNSPVCPAGYRLTGGGIRTNNFNTMSRLASSRPNVETGNNAATAWTCQGTMAVADEINCMAVCARVPGR